MKAGRYTWHIYFAIISTFTCLPCGLIKPWPSGSGWPFLIFLVAFELHHWLAFTGTVGILDVLDFNSTWTWTTNYFPCKHGKSLQTVFFFSAFPAINRTNRTCVTGMVNCTWEASKRLRASTCPSFVRLLIETGASSGSSFSSGFSARKKAEDFWEMFFLSFRFPSLFLNYFIIIIAYLSYVHCHQ